MLKRYLLAPGPTPVPPEALLAMAMPIIHHRSPDFLPVLDAAKKGLQWLYQTKNDVLIICSTGTGGMVGTVNNFFSPAIRPLLSMPEISARAGQRYAVLIISRLKNLK